MLKPARSEAWCAGTVSQRSISGRSAGPIEFYKFITAILFGSISHCILHIHLIIFIASLMKHDQTFVCIDIISCFT